MWTLYLQIIALFGLDNRQNFISIAVKKNKIFIHFQNYFKERTTMLKQLSRCKGKTKEREVLLVSFQFKQKSFLREYLSVTWLIFSRKNKSH